MQPGSQPLSHYCRGTLTPPWTMTPHAPKRKAVTPEPAAPTSRQEVATLEGHLTPNVDGPTARAVWHRRGPGVAAHHRSQVAQGVGGQQWQQQGAGQQHAGWLATTRPGHGAGPDAREDGATPCHQEATQEDALMTSSGRTNVGGGWGWGGSQLVARGLLDTTTLRKFARS